MKISWPPRAAGRRRTARAWIVGAAAVAVAGAAALAAPGAFASSTTARTTANHASTTTKNATTTTNHATTTTNHAATAATHATATTKHATTTTMSGVSGYVTNSMTLSARVKGDSPKGWVKFIYAGKTLCAGQLSDGTASCNHAFYPGHTGTLKIWAVYQGNDTHKSSRGWAWVKVMLWPTTTHVFASPATTTAGGQQVTIIADASNSRQTGYFTFSGGGVPVTTLKVPYQDQVSITHTWTTAGSYTVTVVYSGDDMFARSVGKVTVTVGENPTTTIVTNPFPITEPEGTNATVNVEVVDNTFGGPAPTGTVNVTTVGADNAGLPAGTVYQCEEPATLTPAAGLTTGVPGSIQSGLAYSTGSCTIDTDGGYGFIEVDAYYTPETTEFASSNTVGGNEIKIINLMNTTTTVAAATGTAGDPVTVVATLSANVLAASPENDLYGAPANADTINFTITNAADDVVATCPYVALAGGTAAPANYADCPVPGTLAAGTYTVTAVFAGDEYAAGSTGTGTLTIEAGGGD